MHYINGQWIAQGSHAFTSLNPATQQPLWEGNAAGPAEIQAAVEAARAAFAPWASLAEGERLAYLERFRQHVSEERESLALLIAQETGKVLWDARSEVAAVIGKLDFTTKAYAERTGVKDSDVPGGSARVRHHPHGVMAVYGPYNFPAHLPNGHIMPALLAGNTVVFKPSEQTPAVAQWLVKQWDKAGLPPGVINLVQGERATGIALAQAAVDGVLFTGSSATGKALHAQFAGRPEIILALEMGGNNALIIDRVADQAAAVHETLLSAFTSTGQRCTCARRLILIENESTQQLIDLLVQSASSLRIGAYNSEPEPFMGPVISLNESNRLIKAQHELVEKAGVLLLEMKQPDPALPFVTPCIIDMTGAKAVPDQEYFGPLLQLYRVKSEDEAISVANATAYGLSAAIFSDDRAVYQRLSPKIHAGLINWNRQTTGASGSAPFGGVGASGNHRPAGYYAADYCAYPVASMEMQTLSLPEKLSPGIRIG